jgi:putative membrane protein
MKTNLNWARVAFLLFIGLSAWGCQRSDQSTVHAAYEHKSQTATSSAPLLSRIDIAFLREAEDDAIRLRNLGRVALVKSQDNDFRLYTGQLIADQTSALRDLVELIQKKGIAQSGDMPAVKLEALSKLKRFSGDEFDRQFATLIVKENEKEVAIYQATGDDGTGPGYPPLR